MTIKRTATAALAVIAVAVGLLMLTTTGAQAQDRRACVGKAEFNGLKGGQTRAQIEARWEVSGLGTVLRRGPYRTYVNYPACGFSRTKAGVQVAYALNDGLESYAVLWHFTPALVVPVGSVVPPVLDPPTGQPVATTCDPIPNPLTPCT